MDLRHTNLLDLRRSEKKRLIRELSEGTRSDVVSLWDRIDKTLSEFLLLIPENEEQIYYFGVSMRELFGAFPNRSIELKQHRSTEVPFVFAGGFTGQSLDATLRALKSQRNEQAQQMRVELALRKTTPVEPSDNLLDEMKGAVASLVPFDRD